MFEEKRALFRNLSRAFVWLHFACNNIRFGINSPQAFTFKHFQQKKNKIEKQKEKEKMTKWTENVNSHGIP